jgi:hypothetical protein
MVHRLRDIDLEGAGETRKGGDLNGLDSGQRLQFLKKCLRRRSRLRCFIGFAGAGLGGKGDVAD